MAEFGDWIGRTTTSEERIDRWPSLALAAALDLNQAPEEGDEILPLGHWLYFPPATRQSHMGSDGHPRRGDFLPPLRQPRRMWAGSEIRFHAPIAIGATLKKTSRIADIAEKTGKTGALVFVTVEHEYERGGQKALTEIQNLVYRDDPAPGEAPPPAKPAPANAAWYVQHDPDPVLLFRYSAATFNAHRIHYDEPYARNVEGYPGIIVHGQLTATLMLQAFLDHNSGRRPASFSFRAVKPLFSGATFFVEGAPAEEENVFKLWARNQAGELSMTADLKVS